jgi:hypothetical protein
MSRIARVVVLAFSALMLGSLAPHQADAQVVVRVGSTHRHYYHHHYYYRHGHRYYR